jgi:hypothetical protein
MKPFVAALALSLAALVFALPGRAAETRPWEDVGGGLNDSVFALNTDAPGKLIVGGRFTGAGGVAGTNGIAVWDGTKWSALGTGLTKGSDAVHAIAYKDGVIYAGGTFDGHLKKWNGSQWVSTCGGDPEGPIDTLLIHDTTMYIGGAFQNVAGNPTADSILKCDLPTDTGFSTSDGNDDVVGRVKALAWANDGLLYVGGEFINADQEPLADYIAKYDGTHFKAVGGGKDPEDASIDTANVDALVSDGKNIYVGSDDEEIAGIPGADHIARWNGFTWSSVGAEFHVFKPQSRINAIALHGLDVFVTGHFTDAAGDPLADRVAMFDESADKWGAVGSNGAGNGPFLGEGYALAIYDDKLIVGGGFVDAGGDLEADRLAAYPLSDPVASPTPTVGPGLTKSATATLTKTPAKKIRTKRHKVSVTFKFTTKDAVKAACKLDGGGFKNCTSPAKRRVGRGKHTFSVAGINADGVRGKADVYAFRVVRKR